MKNQMSPALFIYFSKTKWRRFYPHKIKEDKFQEIVKIYYLESKK